MFNFNRKDNLPFPEQLDNQIKLYEALYGKAKVIELNATHFINNDVLKYAEIKCDDCYGSGGIYKHTPSTASGFRSSFKILLKCVSCNGTGIKEFYNTYKGIRIKNNTDLKNYEIIIR
jgi:DnaJ-class molecular chaperone